MKIKNRYEKDLRFSFDADNDHFYILSTNKSCTNLNQTGIPAKSKKQRTTAWILLGVGATFILTGIMIPKGDPVHSLNLKISL